MDCNQKAKKGRRKKIILVFNEEERRNYLTGFHKRKEERRKKARKEIEEKKKEERKKLKEERKNLLKEIYFNQRTVPEVEHLVEPITYELTDHTVTVTSIENIDFVGQDGTRLGQNNFTQYSDDGELFKNNDKVKKINDLKTLTKQLKKQESGKQQKKKSFKKNQRDNIRGKRKNKK